jgi:hypothetical protein
LKKKNQTYNHLKGLIICSSASVLAPHPSSKSVTQKQPLNTHIKNQIYDNDDDDDDNHQHDCNNDVNGEDKAMMIMMAIHV